MPRTFTPMTNAAATAAPKQNSPTSEKPPKAKTTPPTEAPIMAPSWLLVANIPLAVARDSPASSAISAQVTGSNTARRTALALAKRMVSHTYCPISALAGRHDERHLRGALGRRPREGGGGKAGLRKKPHTLSKGGVHTVSHIVPAYRSCNARQHVEIPPMPVQPLFLTLAPGRKTKD